MSMHARFWVSEVTKQVWGGGAVGGKVVLSAVTRKTGDNIDWASATPSGRMEMNVHPDALAWFDEYIGKDLLIEMVPAPEEPAQTD